MAQKIQLKISLEHSKPLIWRRIEMLDTISFKEFHETLQVVMGWQNYHLYEFVINDYSIGIPVESGNDDFLDSTKFFVNEFLDQERMEFDYIYDFGDDWVHKLVIEKINKMDSTINYPRCIKGKGNCPPEDSGGIWGFYDKLEVVKNKKNPRHEEIKEWMGEEYNPADFSLIKINRILAGFS